MLSGEATKRRIVVGTTIIAMDALLADIREKFDDLSESDKQQVVQGMRRAVEAFFARLAGL